MKSSLDEQILNIEELAQYLRIPRSSIYKLAREGQIPGKKVGRHWRFHRDVINHWLAGRDSQDQA